MIGDEKWSNEHIGSMTFWRTVISVVNLWLSFVVVLKVFEVI
jgi:hypothetical protein